MQCPDCKRLRHNGPCDPVYEDEPTDNLEMLRMDAKLAFERYRVAMNEYKEKYSGKSI